jgi:hypothetical protein
MRFIRSNFLLVVEEAWSSFLTTVETEVKVFFTESKRSKYVTFSGRFDTVRQYGLAIPFFGIQFSPIASQPS